MSKKSPSKNSSTKPDDDLPVSARTQMIIDWTCTSIHSKMRTFQREITRVLESQTAPISAEEFLTQFKQFFQVYGEEEYFERVVTSILNKSPPPDSTECMRAIAVNSLPGVAQKLPSQPSKPQNPVTDHCFSSDESDPRSEYGYATDDDSEEDDQTTLSTIDRVVSQQKAPMSNSAKAKTRIDQAGSRSHSAELLKTPSARPVLDKPLPDSIIDLSNSAGSKSPKKRRKNPATQTEDTLPCPKRSRLTERGKYWYEIFLY